MSAAVCSGQMTSKLELENSAERRSYNDLAG